MTQWSYSALKQFQTCAKQYQELRILKNFTSEEGEAARYGKEVHSALEAYVRDGIPLPSNMVQYAKAADALRSIPGDKYCELKMGLKADKITACEFDDPEYWVHGIADLGIIDDTLGFCVDYKTGKSQYADKTQLRLMAIMLFAKFSQLQKIRAGLLFLANNLLIPEEYERRDIPALWVSFNAPLARLDTSLRTGFWPPTPSGLCKRYCPVVTCPHHGT